MRGTTTEKVGYGARVGAPGVHKKYAVHDPRGKKIEHVKGLFVNDGGEPEYVDVGLGFFGLRSILLPVGGVAVNEARRTLTLE